MSKSPKLHSHDLEKGRTSGISSTPGFVLPQRRRKLVIASLLVFAIFFLVYITEQNGSKLSSTSWQWVKDSMRPVSAQPDTALANDNAALAIPNMSPKPGHSTSEARPAPVAPADKEKQYEPTSALIHLAEDMHLSLPTSKGSKDVDEHASASPTHSDQVLLFLSAIKNKAYRVPQSKAQRSAEILPSTMRAFSKSLKKAHGGDTGDEKLYKFSHSAWLNKHRKQSPLTIFSKSYCPFSRRAKDLLTKMGAQFEVYEVDLREDAHSLQDGLRELSGHSTFPTIFIKDEMIGGYDDLARLQSVGVLGGILKGAGVHFD
ncbi:hypothetical protein CBS101457_001780 [Exobasidium rhododendri]|nr:hypothetical protein CBS101457_001780 [Exobasidium rhododendri]